MSTQGDDQSWVARALCASIEPDVLFVQGASQRQVRMRCYECEVRLECLADALDSEANYGVWGGLTERERRAIRAPLSSRGQLAGMVAHLRRAARPRAPQPPRSEGPVLRAPPVGGRVG